MALACRYTISRALMYQKQGRLRLSIVSYLWGSMQSRTIECISKYVGVQ
jgi:hypothetical protein